MPEIAMDQKEPRFLRFRIFCGRDGISHLISTRHGGFSKGLYRSLNLGVKAGDNAKHVEENRKLLAQELGVAPQLLIFPDQCHTDRVGIVEDGSDLTATDALISRQTGIAIGVLAADCVPIRVPICSFQPVATDFTQAASEQLSFCTEAVFNKAEGFLVHSEYF